MKYFLLFVATLIFSLPCPAQIYHPDYVATIVFHGIDSAGPTETGVFGFDEKNDMVDDMCNLMDKDPGYLHPRVKDQITMARYYGDTFPDYYTQADKDDVNSVTAEFGGGIPRYAMIMAKFCKHVTDRSGALQINVAGVSMGALVGRWMIENDYENLASSGKIARFITIEGALCGNWAATNSESIADLIEDAYDMNSIDIQHLNYSWVEDNLHNPRKEMGEAVYGNMIVCHWASTDDDMYENALTTASQEPNDGICLYEDAFFHSYALTALYREHAPTLSHVHATHLSVKQHEGIRAGLAADITSTRRVRITLLDATVLNLPEYEVFGEGEMVFGCAVYSPEVFEQYGITDSINKIGHHGRTVSPVELKEDESVTVNQELFNDFILPGETSLRLEFDLREIDYDTVYQIVENPMDKNQEIDSGAIEVPVNGNGVYPMKTDDWEGNIKVDIIDYPDFIVPATGCSWGAY